ncbi:MAG: hypothetical protein PX640_17275 [Microcystis sp. M49629_WE12]|nr:MULTISPECIES: hypothetical protein [unclassified Microcystis]MCZ8361618.1 hypothetical protein [Microcystis sp. LE19-251.1A]MDJ0528360.1 hypothetical protein [Microcystis sp. M53600_WE12]MDJ0565647.1 hypothetical protein [Microcystis sp. M49629_WE12]MCZ8025650.1 hypothetical protein [Microcystis sp. LE19-10.1B]MDJ0604305.1 hypothetical protein [Microcystis sp. M53602_WE12]
MTPSKSVKPYTLHPTPYPHEKLFQQTLNKKPPLRSEKEEEV